MKDSTMRYYDTKTGRELTVENGGLIPATSGRGPSESKAQVGALAPATCFLAGRPTVVACRDCWRCFGAVEVEPRSHTEICPHCGAFDPHGSPPENIKMTNAESEAPSKKQS